MKKYITILIMFVFCLKTQAQNWTVINKTSPDYHYSLPGTPNTLDTLNIRMAYFMTDSSIVFHVIEFKDTQLDTANASFTSALEQTSGDTLLAMAQSISVTNNSILVSTQNITSFSDYKGLEAKMSYTDPVSGKTLLTYTRFFYNVHTLLTFTIKGESSTQLTTDKGVFFNSISL